MRKIFGIAALAAVSMGFMGIEPAAAVTPIVIPVLSGTLDVGNPIGTITGIKLTAGKTYDFTFSTSGELDVLTQLQAAFQSGHKATAEDIQFSIYNGLPGSGTFVAQSLLTIGPSLDTILGSGAHYVQVDEIAKNLELVSGSLEVSAVPEPATWLSMIFGFGMLGAFMRNRSKIGLLSTNA